MPISSPTDPGEIEAWFLAQIGAALDPLEDAISDALKSGACVALDVAGAVDQDASEKIEPIQQITDALTLPPGVQVTSPMLIPTPWGPVDVAAVIETVDFINNALGSALKALDAFKGKIEEGKQCCE